MSNTEGEKCDRCDRIGDEIWVCTVLDLFYSQFYINSLYMMQGCKLRVYCSSSCQQKDWKMHGMKCKSMGGEQQASAQKGKGRRRKGKKGV